MSKIDDLIEKLCPNGVEYKPIWSLTAWDKKFNGVDKEKQKNVISYKYYLSTDFAKVEKKNGNIKYISTGISGDDRYTTEELAGDYLAEGEVVCIPWGGTPNVKYHKGKFVTGDNRIATSLDINILSNKFLYYWMQSKINVISKFYRGSGIKHPSMKDVLDMNIAVPPLEVQCEIVHILDDFTLLSAELSAELKARKKQFNYYRDTLLTFENDVPRKKLGDICKIISGGDVPKGHWSTEKTDEYKIPIYSNGVEANGLYGYTDNARITEPSVTIAGRGAGCGNSILRKESYFPIIRLLSLVPNEYVDVDYLFYCIKTIKFQIPQSGIPQLTVPMVSEYCIPVPNKDKQIEIVNILKRFDALCNDISDGLPAEIEARQKQYEYYRDKLLTFKELKVNE